MKVEIDRRASYTHAVEALFKAHPGTWISTVDLERAGGRNAWRTRVSNCRRQLGMVIENRQFPIGDRMVSQYRYLPYEPLGPSADVPRDARLF